MSLKKIFFDIITKTDKVFNLSIVESVAEKYLNSQLKGIGKVKDLTINRKLKTFSLNLMLNGEEKEIEVVVGKYGISQNNDFILIRDVQISKLWMKRIADKYVVNKKIAVPKKYRDYLEVLK